jgi:hypothetical protein
MRKIIGWSLIGFVLLLMFAGTAATHGLGVAVFAWGTAIVLCAVIVFAAWLIYD